MQANPKVTLLVIDPQDAGHWVEVRGEVELTEEGALDHLDMLKRQYTDKQQYYGEIAPIEKNKETQVICTIKPKKVTLDAIHK